MLLEYNTSFITEFSISIHLLIIGVASAITSLEFTGMHDHCWTTKANKIIFNVQIFYDKIILNVSIFCSLRCSVEGPLRVCKWSCQDPFHFSPQEIARRLVLCAQQAACMAGVLNEVKEVSAALKLRGKMEQYFTPCRGSGHLGTAQCVRSAVW